MLLLTCNIQRTYITIELTSSNNKNFPPSCYTIQLLKRKKIHQISPCCFLLFFEPTTC